MSRSTLAFAAAAALVASSATFLVVWVTGLRVVLVELGWSWLELLELAAAAGAVSAFVVLAVFRSFELVRAVERELDVELVDRARDVVEAAT